MKNTKAAVFASIDPCSTATNPTIQYPATADCKPILTLSALSGNFTGEICATLPNAAATPAIDSLKVQVKDNNGIGKNGVGIDWQMSSTPKDLNQNNAIGQTLTAANGSTSNYYDAATNNNMSGVATTGLRFGDLPGAYVVDATCPDCNDPKTMSLSAIASCPVVAKYTQGQSPWGNKKYANWCQLVKTGTAEVVANDVCQYDSNGDYAVNKEYTYKDFSNKYHTEQVDYKWWSIGIKGCNLTGAAMIMNWYKYKIDGVSIDPQTLNNLMLPFYKGGDVNLGKIKEITSPDLNLTARIDEYAAWDNPQYPSIVDILNSKLSRCIPVMVKVWNNGVYHFVIVTKREGTKYFINDPGYNNRTSLEDYENTIYGVRVLENPNGVCQQ